MQLCTFPVLLAVLLPVKGGVLPYSSLDPGTSHLESSVQPSSGRPQSPSNLADKECLRDPTERTQLQACPIEGKSNEGLCADQNQQLSQKRGDHFGKHEAGVYTDKHAYRRQRMTTQTPSQSATPKIEDYDDLTSDSKRKLLKRTAPERLVDVLLPQDRVSPAAKVLPALEGYVLASRLAQSNSTYSTEESHYDATVGKLYNQISGDSFAGKKSFDKLHSSMSAAVAKMSDSGKLHA